MKPGVAPPALLHILLEHLQGRVGSPLWGFTLTMFRGSRPRCTKGLLLSSAPRGSRVLLHVLFVSGLCSMIVRLLWNIFSLFLVLEVCGAFYICVLRVFMKFGKNLFVISSCVFSILLSHCNSDY